MKKIIQLFVYLFFILCFNNTFAQNEIPIEIQELMEDFENKEELYEVLGNYCEVEDSLKFKAACFLIENMKGHHSKSYFWQNSEKEKVEFDELEYDNFRMSLSAFKKIKKKESKIKPIPERHSDEQKISKEDLINNIDLAFENWDKEKYNFEMFCEYILPYRINSEPYYNWRKIYKDRFSKIIDVDNSKGVKGMTNFLIDNINLWFVCTFNLEERKEPLPHLGSLQLLHRKKGTCEDVAAVSTFALRSLGIPSTVDVVPYWATSAGGHALNTTFDKKGNPVHFDALLLSDSLNEFIREPAKVFRTTYSNQSNSLVNKIPINKIPRSNFLRSPFYKDVTEEYWPTKDVLCSLDAERLDAEIVYACVFNGGRWSPVWWGEAVGESVLFENMCQGAVFLPKYYRDGKLITAGYPVASGYKKTVTLKPTEEKHTVTVKELAGYIKYRPNHKYRLAYYNYGWKVLGEREVKEETTELTFDNVPKNALLILVSNKGKKMERPFTIDEDGQRLWW